MAPWHPFSFKFLTCHYKLHQQLTYQATPPISWQVVMTWTLHTLSPTHQIGCHPPDSTQDILWVLYPTCFTGIPPNMFHRNSTQHAFHLTHSMGHFRHIQPMDTPPMADGDWYARTVMDTLPIGQIFDMGTSIGRPTYFRVGIIIQLCRSNTQLLAWSNQRANALPQKKKNL